MTKSVTSGDENAGRKGGFFLTLCSFDPLPLHFQIKCRFNPFAGPPGFFAANTTKRVLRSLLLLLQFLHHLLRFLFHHIIRIGGEDFFQVAQSGVTLSELYLAAGREKTRP
jgi:hypothetical protein